MYLIFFPRYSCYEKSQPELGRHLSIEKAHTQLLQHGLEQREFTFHYPEELKRLCYSSLIILALANIKLLETGTHRFLTKTWTPCKLSVKTLEMDHISVVEVGRDLWRYLVTPPPAQAGSPRGGCPGPCLEDF